MMIEYVDTVTTIEIDGQVVTVETKIVELVTIEVPGIQGAKGDKGDKGDTGAAGSRTIQSFVNQHTIQVPYTQGFVGDVFLLAGNIEGYLISVEVNGSSSYYESVGLLKIDDGNQWSTDSKRMGFKDQSSAKYIVFDETVDAWVLGELGDHTTNYRSASNKTVLNNNGILPGSFGNVTIDLNFDSIQSVHFIKSNPVIEYDTVNELINVSFLGKPQVGFLVL